MHHAQSVCFDRLIARVFPLQPQIGVGIAGRARGTQGAIKMTLRLGSDAGSQGQCADLLRRRGRGADAREPEQVAAVRLGLARRLLLLRLTERQQLAGDYERDDRVVERLACSGAVQQD